MKPITKAILVLFMLGGLGLTYQATRTDTSHTVTKDERESLAKLSEKQYIDLATKNCSKSADATEAQCRCIYTTLINDHGVQATYEMDKASTDPNYEYPDFIVDATLDCL